MFNVCGSIVCNREKWKHPKCPLAEWINCSIFKQENSIQQLKFTKHETMWINEKKKVEEKGLDKNVYNIIRYILRTQFSVLYCLWIYTYRVKL